MPRQVPTVTRRGVLAAATGLLAAGPIRRAAAIGDRTVDARLEARSAVVDIDGQPVELLTYNGRFPGPLLRAAEGDLLRVELVNRLDEPTNLHFHGLHVSPSGNSDNVFVTVPPGGRFLYELRIPPGQGGTFWYHPHTHHRLARQLWRGLAGPLIIDRPIDTQPGWRRGRADRGAQGSDRRRRPSRRRTPTADWARGKSGKLVLANGQQQPVLHAGPAPVWLRLVNACNGRMLLLAREDGRPLTVIAHDGRLLEARRRCRRCCLRRPSASICCSRSTGREPVRLVHRPYNRGARREPPASETLFTLRTARTESRRRWPSARRTIERLDAAAASQPAPVQDGDGVPARRGRRPHGADPRRAWASWNAGRSPTSTRRITCSTCTPGSSRSGGSTAWRRPIPPGATPSTCAQGSGSRSWCRSAISPGRSVFHCHIAEHGDAGMMGIVEVDA